MIALHQLTTGLTLDQALDLGISIGAAAMAIGCTIISSILAGLGTLRDGRRM